MHLVSTNHRVRFHLDPRTCSLTARVWQTNRITGNRDAPATHRTGSGAPWLGRGFPTQGRRQLQTERRAVARDRPRQRPRVAHVLITVPVVSLVRSADTESCQHAPQRSTRRPTPRSAIARKPLGVGLQPGLCCNKTGGPPNGSGQGRSDRHWIHECPGATKPRRRAWPTRALR